MRSSRAHGSSHPRRLPLPRTTMSKAASYTPLADPERTPQTPQFNIHDPSWDQLHAQDQHIKTRVRWLRIIIRTLAFGCSYLPSPFAPPLYQASSNPHSHRIVVLSLMIDNLVVFYETSGTVADGIHLWPQDAKLWPTYVALAVAAVTALLATATLCAYFWGTKVANRWNMARIAIAVVSIIFSIVLWAIAAYGLQSTSSFDGVGSQSLWSATCDSTDQQHELFGHVINFNQFCLMQVSGPSLFPFPFVFVCFWNMVLDLGRHGG